MNLSLNSHPEIKPGQHAILSGSTYVAGRSPEKTVQLYQSRYSKDIGTAIHDMICKRIKKHRKFPSEEVAKDAIMTAVLDADIPMDAVRINYIWQNCMNYVNDAIGFGMIPEVIVKYSDNAFGWMDAFIYYPETKTLRIHDYKSGFTPIHREQTLTYAAFFCLEYEKQWNLKIDEMTFIFHVYQTVIDKETKMPIPTIIDIPGSPELVKQQMESLIKDDKIIRDTKEGKYVLL